MNLMTQWWLSQLRSEADDVGGDAGGGGTDMTTAGDDAGGDAGGDPAPSFLTAIPETWRAELGQAAGFDEKQMKQLDRVSDIPSLTKSWFDAQQKIRSGMVASPLPQDASPEQIAEWREANGVPLEASAYEVNMGEVTPSEADERILAEVAEVALQHNVNSKAFDAMVGMMMQAREKEYEAQEQQDGLQAVECRRELEGVWGKENVERNTNAIRALLNKMPEESRENLMNARTPDGKALFNDPAIMQFFSATAFDLNPAGAVMPNDGAGVPALQARIKEIETMMSDDPDAYYKDQDVQNELTRLYEAMEKIEQRGDAA